MDNDCCELSKFISQFVQEGAQISYSPEFTPDRFLIGFRQLFYISGNIKVTRIIN